MDTIPDEIYQHIFGYFVSDDVTNIFWGSSWYSEYKLQFVNKTFQRNFRSYIKTSPLDLYLSNDEWSLQLVRALKRYDVIGIYRLHLEIGYRKDCVAHDIIKTLDGINFTSLRELYLEEGEEFDYEILKECKELTSITLGPEYSEYLDEIQREKVKTFLSVHKHTVECLRIPLLDDIVPNDLVSWPKLNELIIDDTRMTSKSTVIESSTLQELWIFYFLSCDMVIKCPNLKVLHVENQNYDPDSDDPDDDIELEERPRQSDDNHHGEEFEFTCHPSELRKYGMEVVEISSNCDICIDMSYVYRWRQYNARYS